MKRSERLAAELESVTVDHNRLVSVLRMLAVKVLEGSPRAKDMATDILMENSDSAVLRDIEMTESGLKITGEHWSMEVMGHSFSNLLTKPDGTYWNNLETRFSPAKPGGPRIVVTVQNVSGKTPVEQRLEAEAKVAALETENANLRALINELENGK